MPKERSGTIAIADGNSGRLISFKLVDTEASKHVERRILETIPIAGTDEELQMMLVTFPPGAQSDPHVHPVQGLNYIIDGAAESQYQGQEKRSYKAGDSYLDLADKPHLVFRNTSQTAPLKFLIAYKIKRGLAFKQDLPVASLR